MNTLSNKLISLVALTLVLLPLTARAERPETDVETEVETEAETKPASAAQAPAVSVERQDEYDPKVARLLSALSTLVPVAAGGGLTFVFASRDVENPAPLTATAISIGSAGLIVGPSVGHLYAGNLKQGFINMGLRIGFGVLGAFSMGEWLSVAFCDSDGPSCTDHRPWAIPTFFLSCVGLFGTVIYDLATASRSARRANEALRNTPKVSVAPFFGDRAGGLALSATF